MHDGTSRYRSLVTTFATLITTILFNVKIFFMVTFRAFESIGPPDLKKMFTTVFFCFKAIHKICEVYFFLLHIFHTFSDNLSLLSHFFAH